jgi:membrane AbrB-like protein
MQRLKTFAAAAVGVVIFQALSLPLPFLLGPMFACLAVALAGARMTGAPAVSDLMRTILGVAVGASVTPELVGRLGAMAASVALVPLFVLVIGAIGYPYFRRLCGLDGPTAYYAAMPGGLQDMIVFGQEAGADPRALSLIHATRVLVIVSAMPVILTLGWGMSFAAPPGAPALSIPPHELALMAFCAVAGWKGAERLGLFGASILGPLALTAAFSLAGLIHHRPPAEAILAAQFFIGLGVGVKYVGVTLDELRRFVLASLGFCAMLAGLSVVFAEGVYMTGLAPQVEAILAFAPGGQAEMAVLAIVAGVDVAFVVTHHLVRIVVVITGAPIAARLLRWRR